MILLLKRVLGLFISTTGDFYDECLIGNLQLHKWIHPDDTANLSKDVTWDELFICSTIGPDETPGRDGFAAYFFKNRWNWKTDWMDPEYVSAL